MVSRPFAIITAVGKSMNKKSVPFFFGINNIKNKAIDRFRSKRIQLFLNELLIDKVFGDFKNIEIIVTSAMQTDIQ